MAGRSGLDGSATSSPCTPPTLVDNLSQAELSLIRRAAALTVELEHLEDRFAAAGGATADQLKTFQMVVNTLRRLHETLGLRRRAKNVTPPGPLDYARDYSRRGAVDIDEIEPVEG